MDYWRGREFFIRWSAYRACGRSDRVDPARMVSDDSGPPWFGPVGDQPGRQESWVFGDPDVDLAAFPAPRDGAPSIGPRRTKAGIFLASWLHLGRSWFLCDAGQSHVLVMAPTRSGKGAGVVIPTLLTWPHSTLVHDLKGENWPLTAVARAGGAYLPEVRSDRHHRRERQIQPAGAGAVAHRPRSRGRAEHRSI